jgi:putative ABC transport system ATP-binding protein
MSEDLFLLEGISYKHISYPKLSIPKDKVTFIQGESGSGKTTLLRLLNAMLTPNQGGIKYVDTDIMNIDTLHLRREVLLISQNVFLFSDTIRGNFEKFYDYRNQTAPTEEIIRYFLEICCIDMDLDKDCSVLSGGERQRVYIAIFLSFLPKAILLDEPTSALDAITGEKVLDNILTLCKEKGITPIIVSHDNTLVEKFGENIIIVTR